MRFTWRGQAFELGETPQLHRLIYDNESAGVDVFVFTPGSFEHVGDGLWLAVMHHPAGLNARAQTEATGSSPEAAIAALERKRAIPLHLS